MIDAVVVGAGPNGLAAAVMMARAGLQVEVFEAAATVGGGTRTQELLEPGHLYDVCSAVHPMSLASPFFRQFGLAGRVDFETPELSFGSPLDGGRAALAYRSLDRTAEALGPDGPAYARLFAPLIKRVDGVMDLTQNQLLRVPRDPVAAAVFALRTVEQGTALWNARFRGPAAPALITGAAAHAVGRHPSLAATGAGLMLTTLAHAGGWPVPRGGSQAIADAMAADITAHDGVIHTGRGIRSLKDLPTAKAVLLDVAPAGFSALAGDSLPQRYRNALDTFRYGNGSCKVDFILSAPVPWSAGELADAGTVHVGGSRNEMAEVENEVARGHHPGKPYVLVAQPSRFDPTRAPSGRHILWTYCHVPHGSTVDMSQAVIGQLERFAPGFRELVVGYQVTTAAQLSEYNANYVGGDFSSGAMDLLGLVRRPVLSPAPWRTPLPGVYLCSSSTPPGPGVTGMPGYFAARQALRDVFGLATPELASTPA